MWRVCLGLHSQVAVKSQHCKQHIMQDKNTDEDKVLSRNSVSYRKRFKWGYDEMVSVAVRGQVTKTIAPIFLTTDVFAYACV